MKKSLTTIIIAMMIPLLSCNKTEEFNVATELPPTVSNYAQAYNMSSENLMYAVSEAIRINPDFRRLIKDEVMQQNNGDYEILLSDLAPKTLKDNSTTRTETNTSVEELLSRFYPNSAIATRTDTKSCIQALYTEYPDIQIAVPLHAEEWDPETYIPTVCFVPSNYKDLITKTVPGIDPEGNMIEVDAINKPDVPVIVISRSERYNMIKQGLLSSSNSAASANNIIGDSGIINPTWSASIFINGVFQGNAIRINWKQGVYLNCKFASYTLLRSGPDGETVYKQIYSSTNANSLSYNDWDIEPNKEYRYKIRLNVTPTTGIAGWGTYIESEEIIIIANGNLPKSVTNFSVEPTGPGKIELSWNNPEGEMYNTRIEKRTDGNEYKIIATLAPSQDMYVDEDIWAGEKVSYIVRKIDHTGRLSNKCAAYTYATYRDPNYASPVYLKQITCDCDAVEGWLAGKPEFTIKIGTINENGEAIDLGTTIDAKFASRSNTSQIFSNKLMHRWQYYSHLKYYPTLTFIMIEYDIPSVSMTANFGISVGVKLADIIELQVERSLSFTFANFDKNCGSASLLYYENPEQWLTFPNYDAKILISQEP